MRTSNRRPTRYSGRFAAFCLGASIVIFVAGQNTLGALQPGRKEQQRPLKTASVKPNETKGAPFKPAKPSKRIPNEEIKPRPVPTGPKVGNMKPANPAIELKQITDRG